MRQGDDLLSGRASGKAVDDPQHGLVSVCPGLGNLELVPHVVQGGVGSGFDG